MDATQQLEGMNSNPGWTLRKLCRVGEKPVLKVYILHDSTYVTCAKFIEMQNRLVAAVGWCSGVQRIMYP